MSDDLATYAITRDPEIRDALAVKHLPLAKFVARKMAANLPSHIELDDLVSWGSIGLLDAIDKFDPTRGTRFSTYAVTRIRGAILDGLQKLDWAPKQVTSKVRLMARVSNELANELGAEPSIEQVAERMGVAVAQVRSWRHDKSLMIVRPMDSPSPTGEERGWEVAEEADQEVAGEVAEIRRALMRAVHGLEARDQAVFLLYYRDSLTLREIADTLGVSVSSATQAHTRMIENIRNRLSSLGRVA